MARKVLFEVEGDVTGVTITSPLFPELLTGGASLEEALSNLPDAIGAVFQMYDEEKKPLPTLA